ncbi:MULTISPECIES: LppU/SCO3897 family protein [Streptomyces]|uniref:Uncharacterized protein n=1 Tax=Streptomyces viridochromogenes TaxID=1938 RepID=A0A0L8K8I8_STRVR|nr:MULTISPECIES: hypothetical protein [Streptomyces]KOG22193.1 hypothetical protein ADK34_22150 [Streptomyces viridochromogenes]
MSTQEIPLTLTPQQAAQGVILTVQLPSGPAHLTVRPCRHGELVAARLGDGTVHLRITVAGAAAPKKSGGLGCLVTLCVIGALVGGSYLLGDDKDDAPGSRGPGPVPTFSYEPFPSLDPTSTPTEEQPDPYEKGTCLNGSLPDSTTAQSVDDVEEVPCSASDAHYKVIQTFPFTSDMNNCNSNPKTQYAFSHRYTMNGTTVSEYVYCLVGLGSYAR